MEDRADEAAAQGRSDAQSIAPDPSPGQRPPSESARMLASLIGNLDGIVFRCHDDPHFTLEFVGGR